MCGIAGFIDFRRQMNGDELTSAAQKMAASLRHRGPDHQGIWVDPSAGVALTHRRLSILDLSPEGHQPMISSTGRYIITFNGEIYNFKDIRERLLKEAPHIRLRGRSDTEIMLVALEQWGIETSVRRFNGMFAFALWDRSTRQLTMARDRMGEKPLYYSGVGHCFLFASELKALLTHPRFSARIDRDALAAFLRYGYVPAPYSIYEKVHKLPPANLLTISLDHPGDISKPNEYWSLRHLAAAGLANPFQGSEQEAVDQLEMLLRDAVRIRTVADVPLGAFLSGGIDSSAVVGLMQAESTRPVQTFTIGFQECGYDEAQHAKAVARHLATDHHELYVTSHEAIDVIPLLPHYYDEPFGDSSEIPTCLISRMARREVTVSLSGDGGDEVFGGYNRYVWAPKIWRKFSRFPLFVRRCSAAALDMITPDSCDKLHRVLAPVLPDSWQHHTPGDKLQKLAQALVAATADDFYVRLISRWMQPSSVVVGSTELPSLVARNGHEFPSFSEKMMFLDAISYLPDDILVKLDRASMAVSLESRVPFLDHRVVEFAWRLPLPMKIRNGQGKWLLRQVLYKYVPAKLIERPKTGFSVPLHEWLRGPLRSWAEELLEPKRLREDGYLDPKAVRTRWAEHLSRKYNWAHPLWNVLMFQSWLQNNRNPRSAAVLA